MGKWLEVEFHPLLLCKRVEATLKLIEEDDEKSQLQQYLPALREITLVRLLKQVSQVYQSICFKRLLDLAPFATSFELERVIVDCVRHNDMQIRVDHRSRTVHFGTELAEAQSISETEGPHLQDMPSEQFRKQLMVMQETLERNLKIINPDRIKDENLSLRRSILDCYQKSKDGDHLRLLERQKHIERRKEYLEQLSLSRTEEEQKRQEIVVLENQKKEEARLALEREEREKAKAQELLMEKKQQHLKEKVQQLMQTEIGKKVMQKLDDKTLAEIDFRQLNIKQEEEMENEKRLLHTRLRNQERTLDHTERAKRKLEIPLLEEIIKNDYAYDEQLWQQKEQNRIADAIAERSYAIKNRDRLGRMKEDKLEFMSTLLSQRRTKYEEKLAEYEDNVRKERKIRLENRRLDRIEERKRKYKVGKAEEEKRLQDEELKRKKEEKEQEEAKEKAKRDEDAEMQRQRKKDDEKPKNVYVPRFMRNLNNQSKDNNSHDKEKLEAQVISTNREVSQWKKGGNTAQSPARVRDASEEIDEGKSMWKKGGTRVQPPYQSERVGDGYRDMRGRDGYSDQMPEAQDR